MEEYRQLRTEVASLLGRIESLLRYSLVVSAAVYAWLVVQSVGLETQGKVAVSCLRLPAKLLMYGWWIPPAFVLLAGIGAGVTRWRVEQMSTYLRSLEIRMGYSDLGWEDYIQRKASVITWTTVLIWLLVLGGAGWATYKGYAETWDAKERVCPQKTESVSQ
jgi:hypothetical protein